MKQVKINLGKVGVVTRNGKFRKILTEGIYFIGLWDEIVLFDMSLIYNDSIILREAHKVENTKSVLGLIEVGDDQMVLKYEGLNYKSVLSSGRYFYWKGKVDYKFKTVDLSKVEITENIANSVISSNLFVRYTRTFNIEAYEEGLLFIDNKFIKKLSEGIYRFWQNSTKIEVLKVDKRQLQLEISGQEILTKDKASLRVNFFTQYKVFDIEKAVLKSKNYEKQLYIMFQLILREFIGSLTLDQLLENKESVSEYVMNNIENEAKNIGVKIMCAGIRDIILSGEMKSIMNKVLVAEKQAQANIIMRREETASTRSLLNTAKLMENNEMLFRLKEMEYVEKIADKIGEITLSSGSQVIDQLKTVFSK